MHSSYIYMYGWQTFVLAFTNKPAQQLNILFMLPANTALIVAPGG